MEVRDITRATHGADRTGGNGAPVSPARGGVAAVRPAVGRRRRGPRAGRLHPPGPAEAATGARPGLAVSCGPQRGTRLLSERRPAPAARAEGKPGRGVV